MKNSKLRRALLLVASAVLLVCVSVGATLAFLTDDTAVVTNTFSVGNVKITLDEAPVDLYGVVVEGERRTENDYKLIPGHEYTKDPTIHIIAGSENCFVFVRVVDGIADIQADKTIAAQMAELGWKALPTDLKDAKGNPIDATNIYYKEAAVAAGTDGTDVKVFEKFKLKGDADVAAFAGKTITVQAYAVQADGFNGSATAAYAAAPCTWNANATDANDVPATTN